MEDFLRHRGINADTIDVLQREKVSCVCLSVCLSVCLGVGEAGGSVGRASDFGSKGLRFESAKGKICTALFFGVPVFEITFVVEKDVKS